MIFNIFNSLFVFATIEAHSIKTYHSNFVCNHDSFVNQGCLNQVQIINDFLKVLNDPELADPELAEKSRRFKIRFNLPSHSFNFVEK